MVPGRAVVRLAPVPGGGTDLDFAMEYRLPGGPLGRLVDRTVGDGAGERAARQEMESFKACAERDAWAGG